MQGETMQALRVQVAGRVTSFRHPHFVHGVQPSYEMPPPATLYGHVCSALGELVSPDAFNIAFHFTYQTRWLDYEHTHLFGGEKSKLSPFERELLFEPRLVLYLDRPDWLDAFRNPRYVVTLGRSQDLMTYERVESVTLRRVSSAYIAHTLLPHNEASSLKQRVLLRLPRYIDANRRAAWMDYAQVGAPQRLDSPAWVDPDAAGWRDRQRAVQWLTFVD